MRSSSFNSTRLLALGALAAIAPACTLLLGDFDRGGTGTSTGTSTSAGGSGGGGSTTTSSSGSGGGTSSSSSSGSGGQCTSDGDCPATGNECTTPRCDPGTHMCGVDNVAANTPLSQQTAGDCKQAVCDGSGSATTVADDTDLPDDGKGCTADSCSGGMGVHTPISGSCSDNGGKICADPTGPNAGNCIQCNVAADCTAPDLCDTTSNKCVPPACSNGAKDGQESDIDCGGPLCGPCGPGKKCMVAGDCTSMVCDPTLHECAVATCTDNVKNGSETGKDCGGVSCGPCAAGQGCMSGADCVSKVCDASMLICAMATCTDGVQNGAETAKDCGGSSCGPCANGQGCSVDTDCTSLVCKTGVCQAPTCTDGKKNGAETGKDCGGPTCGPCGAGEGCSKPADCQSDVCNNGICTAPSCTDGLENQGESDIDCGGPCGPCGFGKKCTADADCKGELCAGGLCDVNPLVTGQGGPWGITNDGTSVYWTNNLDGSVSSIPIAGGAVSHVVVSGLAPAARGIVRDSGSYVYWLGQNSVSRVQLPGGNPTQLYSFGSADKADLVTDGTDVYFSRPCCQLTKYASGGGITNLYNSESGITQMAFAAPNTLYWVSNQGTKKGTTAGAASTVLYPVYVPVTDLAADANALYGALPGPNGSIISLKNGSNMPTALATNLTDPEFLALDASFVYWTDTNGGTVSKVPISGGAVTTIAKGQGAPKGITVTNTYVFWVNNTDGTVMRSLK